jgi:hypothetical protein
MPEKSHKKKSPHHRKTQKNSDRVWMFRKGNVVVCYRKPFIQIQSGQVGGAAGPDFDKQVDELFNKINLSDKSEKEFFKNNRPKLANDLLNSLSSPSLKIVSDKLKGQQVDDSEVIKAIQTWVIKKKIARELVDDLKNKIKDRGDLYNQADIDALEKTLDREDMCSVKGKLSSIASSAFNGLSKGATSLGKFLTPEPNADINRYNENIVQMSWFPQSRLHYKRGNSTAVDRKKFKMGDFMVYVQPEKYSDTPTYLSNMFGSVEDLFTNVLQGCQGAFCTKGDVHRTPVKQKIVRTINRQPQRDFEALTSKGPIEIQ